MRRPTRCAMILPLALLCCGCISRSYHPYHGPPHPPHAGAVAVSLGSDRSGAPDPLRLERRAAPAAAAHDVYSLSFASVGHNGQDGDRVEATYYRGRAPGRHRLVVVLPIYGDSSYPQRKIVHRLLHGLRGPRTHVLEVAGEKPLFDWTALGAATTEEAVDRELRRAGGSLAATVADVRRLLRWAESRREVDPQRIGIVGFSIGAITASLVMGMDERPSAGVFVMGGAHPHQILAACRGRAGRARRQVLDHLGWSAEEFAARAEAILAPLDPARHAAGIHPGDVLVVDASADHCIPPSAREDFWTAMGRPERVSLAYGHRVAFLSMTPLGFWYTARLIEGFLDERLPVGGLFGDGAPALTTERDTRPAASPSAQRAAGDDPAHRERRER